MLNSQIEISGISADNSAYTCIMEDKIMNITVYPVSYTHLKALPENTASAEDRCEMVRRLTAEKTWAMLDTIERCV